MFEKFGEMGSFEEVNLAAEGLKNEGDKESLYALAEENGVDKEDAEDYLLGYTQELIPNAISGALAKLKVEISKNTKLYEGQELINDWISRIRMKVMEEDVFARAVRSKGKSLKGCIASILGWSFKNMVYLDSELVQAACVEEKLGIGRSQRVALGVPGMRTASELIDKYYLSGDIDISAQPKAEPEQITENEPEEEDDDV